MNSSLLTIITTIAEVGALAGLLWQLILNRRESRVRFLISVYEGHEDKLNRTLDDGKRLKSYADRRGIGINEARQRIMATIDINDAYVAYLIHKHNLVSDNASDKYLEDVKGLFMKDDIKQRWQMTKNQYSTEFRDFIGL